MQSRISDFNAVDAPKYSKHHLFGGLRISSTLSAASASVLDSLFSSGACPCLKLFEGVSHLRRSQT
jgi:hypothetical protein